MPRILFPVYAVVPTDAATRTGLCVFVDFCPIRYPGAAFQGSVVGLRLAEFPDAISGGGHKSFKPPFSQTFVDKNDSERAPPWIWNLPRYFSCGQRLFWFEIVEDMCFGMEMRI